MDNNELKHHGVQGMKWGVKHGPPYPLSRQGISRSEYRKMVARSASRSTQKYGGIFKKRPITKPKTETQNDSQSEGIVVREGGSKEYKKQMSLVRKITKERIKNAEAYRKKMKAITDQKRKEIAKEKAIAKNLDKDIRKEILDHGDAKEVASIIKTLSTEEIQQVLNRLDMEAKLLSKIPKDPKDRTSYEKFTDILNKTNEVTRMLNTSITHFDNALNFYNKLTGKTKDNNSNNNNANNNNKDSQKHGGSNQKIDGKTEKVKATDTSPKDLATYESQDYKNEQDVLKKAILERYKKDSSNPNTAANQVKAEIKDVVRDAQGRITTVTGTINTNPKKKKKK